MLLDDAGILVIGPGPFAECSPHKTAHLRHDYTVICLLRDFSVVYIPSSYSYSYR